MRFSTLIPLLLAAGLANAQAGQGKNGQNGQGKNGQNGQGQNGQGNGQNGQGNAQNGQGQNNNNNANNANNALALNPANVQTASQSDGFAKGKEAGQAASATDNANFINFCTGKTLTNGLQVRTGSCNGIVMGEIPAANRMISAIITNPKDGDNVTQGQPITFSVKIANLQAGSFTNPDVTYYAAPQALSGGQVVGHTHISVQDMGGNKNPANTLDAEKFAFFKGINDNGNGQGLLSANLAAGLPAGTYRVCSITSASNHQPVVMPVAQRGPQDDCIRFVVNAAGAGNNNNNNNQQGQGQAQQGQGQKGQAQQGQGQKGQAQQGQGQQGQAQQGQGQQGQGQQAQQGQGQKGQGQQGQGQKGQGQGQAGRGRGRGRGRMSRPKFAARDFVA